MNIFTLLANILDDLIESNGLYTWSRADDTLYCYADNAETIADNTFNLDTNTLTLIFRYNKGWNLAAVLDDNEARHDLPELVTRHIRHSERLYTELCNKVGDMGSEEAI